MRARLISGPFSEERLGDYLKSRLSQEKWTHFNAAIAFVKESGMRHLADELFEFSSRADVRILVGIDLQGSSQEGLSRLIDNVVGNGQVLVYHNENTNTFHPKVYMFKSDVDAAVLVGSGNLTEGGFFTNNEATLALSLDLADEEDKDFLHTVEETLDSWSDPAMGLVRHLTAELLDELVAQGYVLLEAKIRELQRNERRPSRTSAQSHRPTRLFPRIQVPAAPPRPRAMNRRRLRIGNTADYVAVDDIVISTGEPIPVGAGAGSREFVMTVKQTDVGYGQTTPGAAQRSPELFIPKIARDYAPDFWGWPNLFIPDPKFTGKPDANGYGRRHRKNVRFRFRGAMVNVKNIWYNPEKIDIRIGNAQLRRGGQINDILHIVKAKEQQGYDYELEFVSPQDSRYASLRERCTNSTPASAKRWGYF